MNWYKHAQHGIIYTPGSDLQIVARVKEITASMDIPLSSIGYWGNPKDFSVNIDNCGTHPKEEELRAVLQKEFPYSDFEVYHHR